VQQVLKLRTNRAVFVQCSDEEMPFIQTSSFMRRYAQRRVHEETFTIHITRTSNMCHYVSTQVLLLLRIIITEISKRTINDKSSQRRARRQSNQTTKSSVRVSSRVPLRVKYPTFHAQFSVSEDVSFNTH